MVSDNWTEFQAVMKNILKKIKNQVENKPNKITFAPALKKGILD